jgi:hypothetical protein
VFFNTATNPSQATDFYIKSLQILDDAPSVAGDYNNNGIVDAADYVIWRKNLGQSFQLTNEVAGVTPGMVTAEDYGAWRSRFGGTSGSTSAGVVAAVPEPSAAIMLMAGLMTTFVVARRRLGGRWSAYLIGITLLPGCDSGTMQPAAPAQAPPAICGLPVNMTVKQRSTTAVPGSNESLRITIDDITAGQVMVSLASAEGEGVFAATSLKQGDAAEFTFNNEKYQLALSELKNELVGEDFATLVVSSGGSPSPALPARGRESEEVTEDIARNSPSLTLPPRGRESDVVIERKKIERLLAAIESAEGDVFIRNGAEHSAKDAAGHLRTKWQAAGDQIKTAEEFIDKIATKSSLSGEAYSVRVANGTEVPASEYLREKLGGIENRQPAGE